MRGRLTFWLVVCAGWTVLAVAFAVASSLTYALNYQPPRWRYTLTMAVTEWYVWAALTPLVAWLARRYRVTQPRQPARRSLGEGGRQRLARVEAFGDITTGHGRWAFDDRDRTLVVEEHRGRRRAVVRQGHMHAARIDQADEREMRTTGRTCGMHGTACS